MKFNFYQFIKKIQYADLKISHNPELVDLFPVELL